MPDDNDNKTPQELLPENDLDKFLDKKEEMDTIFKEKFTKRVTVMFTDLKGSTSVADREGDLSSRLMIKHLDDIIFPIIARNNGVLVKTMGDGTLSYFENAQEGVRTAAGILREVDGYNVTKKSKTPILMRIGLHTGQCIIEKDDIFGDVVNTASRFETTANPGEAHISEETYDSMTDKAEIYCRFIKTTSLKGKDDKFKVYKVFWNKEEAEKTVARAPDVSQAGRKLPNAVKIILLTLISLIITLAIIQGPGLLNRLGSFLGRDEEKRSITHSVGDTKKTGAENGRGR